MALDVITNRLDFATLRKRSLERLTNVPLILRRNRKKEKKKEEIKKEPDIIEVPYDTTKKPPYSYMAMIEMALTTTPDLRMSLQDIYQFIEKRFVYFKNAKPGWKNSVRHNLSLHDSFYREQPYGSKISYWCMRRIQSVIPNIEDIQGPCIPQNRTCYPEAELSGSDIFLKLEPVEPVTELDFYPAKPKSTPIEIDKENIPPSGYTTPQPSSHKVLRLEYIDKSALTEVKTQDSGFQSDSCTTLSLVNVEPTTPVKKNDSFDSIVDRYYIGDINEMNFSRDSFMDFINDLSTPFSALSSNKKTHSSRKKLKSPFNPLHSSTPARRLNFGNKRRSGRALFTDPIEEDELPIPAKRAPQKDLLDLLP